MLRLGADGVACGIDASASMGLSGMYSSSMGAAIGGKGIEQGVSLMNLFFVGQSSYISGGALKIITTAAIELL